MRGSGPLWAPVPSAQHVSGGVDQSRNDGAKEAAAWIALTGQRTARQGASASNPIVADTPVATNANAPKVSTGPAPATTAACPAISPAARGRGCSTISRVRAPLTRTRTNRLSTMANSPAGEHSRNIRDWESTISLGSAFGSGAEAGVPARSKDQRSGHSGRAGILVLGGTQFWEKRATGEVSAEKGGRQARESNPERPKSALPKVVGSCYDGDMTKSNRGSQERTLGAKAYASMARVEGLRLSKESMARLENTKGLSPEKRRAEVLRTYSANPPKRK